MSAWRRQVALGYAGSHEALLCKFGIGERFVRGDYTVETALKTKNMFGGDLYQVRARKALPILVRQALSRNPIFYEALAAELGMSNPRNLNFVLGSIGTTLNELSGQPGWSGIPQIQSLVINKQRQLPGEGFETFLATRMGEYQRLSLPERRAYLNAYWQDVYAYSRWHDVLAAFDLVPSTDDIAKLIETAKTGKGAGGGEGEEHRRLKEHVAAKPGTVGLPHSFAPGRNEAPLPSGDRLDVLFDSAKRKVAVEVKSMISNEVDLTRGLFQCVKYRAVMEAERGSKGEQYSIDVILVVGKTFPHSLRSLQSSLAVHVVEVLDLN